MGRAKEKHESTEARHRLHRCPGRLRRSTGISSISHQSIELRFLTIAEIDSIFYTVAWTWRGSVVRIISARRARNEERRDYRSLHGRGKNLERCAVVARAGKRISRRSWRSTEAELEASIDHEEEGEVDWSTLSVELPRPKVAFTMRYDPEVPRWFRAQGAGYQTRINAVLKAYIDAQAKKSA